MRPNNSSMTLILSILVSKRICFCFFSLQSTSIISSRIRCISTYDINIGIIVI